MGGGNNNVIIRIPSKNEYINILQNNDLNGTINTTSSKSNVWNFNYSGSTFDYSMLQDNSTYSFSIPSKIWGGSYIPSYYIMDKSQNTSYYESIKIFLLYLVLDQYLNLIKNNYYVALYFKWYRVSNLCFNYILYM